MGIMGRLAFGFRRPRTPVLGTCVVGDVVAVGEGVTGLNIGDRVAGMTGIGGGGHGEYCRVPAKACAPVPHTVTDEHAVAALFGGVTALHFLRKANLKQGESILVMGASGAVGSAMVQLAVYQEAKVTATTSGKNEEWVKQLGAESVVDYSRTSLQALDDRFDIIADTVAASTFGEARHALNEHGRYLVIAGGLPDMLARPSGTKRPIKGVAPEDAAVIKQLLNLVAEGAITPVIHDTLSWQQIPEGHALVETGHKRGSLVVMNTPRSWSG
jgi:NADPH:quinone reductase-like Zn-dependent oxidoreductase